MNRAGNLKPDPIFASELTAARLLDMKPDTFRNLVEAGHLPAPVTIGGRVQRYDVEELRRVVRGDALPEGMVW